MTLSTLARAFLVGIALAGCKTEPAARSADDAAAEDAPSAASEPREGEPPPTLAPGPSLAPPPAGEASPVAPPQPGVARPAPTAPSPAGPPERHGPPLPELSVKSFGLHIGGGAADSAARPDFQRALEAASGRYLDCYRLIEAPGTEGTFGADLTVAGTGGKPSVGKPRTRLRGSAFQACMVRAFESVSFGRPPSGRAVVVSYSVKFKLTD